MVRYEGLTWRLSLPTLALEETESAQLRALYSIQPCIVQESTKGETGVK